jgi:hypothetical protein
MSSNLGDLLILTRPIEVSGSRSHNRFDYQANWALCRLLELHSTGDDYVIVLDYHDDVLVLDSATDPTKVLFYQVKSKSSGEWRRSDFTATHKNSRSIIAKLYNHYIFFAKNVAGLTFVTNAGFSVRLTNDSKATACDTFTYSELHQKEQAEIETAICNQLTTSAPIEGASLLRFERCSLSHTDHTNHALGKLIDFLENISGSNDLAFKTVNAFFRSLKMEILRGCTEESSPASFSELCKLKAISKSQFDSMISRVLASVPQPNWTDIIRQRLTVEGVSFVRTEQLCANVTRFVANRFDPMNSLLSDAVDSISTAVGNLSTDDMQLDSAILLIYENVRNDSRITLLKSRQSQIYVHAIIGVLLHEYQALPFTNPPVEDQE